MTVSEKEQNRKLSPAEQARLERFESISADLDKKGYERRELTVGMGAANVIGILSTLPICALLAWGFIARNGFDSLAINSMGQLAIVIVAFVVLIVVHEGIHGLTWAAFSENHFADIEFGFIKQTLTPYCTCKAPLARAAYVTGTLAPLVVLGIVPGIVAIFTGSATLFAIALLMVLAAGGDVLIVIKALAYRSKSGNVLIFDHPTQAGCVVFEQRNAS